MKKTSLDTHPQKTKSTHGGSTTHCWIINNLQHLQLRSEKLDLISIFQEP